MMRAHPTLFIALTSRTPTGECFECGDGWQQIVDEASGALTALASAARAKGFHVVQVKEKMGTLRIYVTGDVPAGADEVIEAARARSEVTCEWCGRPGQLRWEDGWARTVCTLCRVKRP